MNSYYEAKGFRYEARIKIIITIRIDSNTWFYFTLLYFTLLYFPMYDPPRTIRHDTLISQCVEKKKMAKSQNAKVQSKKKAIMTM
jgi:hypothetical protein